MIAKVSSGVLRIQAIDEVKIYQFKKQELSLIGKVFEVK